MVIELSPGKVGSSPIAEATETLPRLRIKLTGPNRRSEPLQGVKPSMSVSQSCKRPKEKDCRRASAGACDNERLKEKLPEGLDLDVV